MPLKQTQRQGFLTSDYLRKGSEGKVNEGRRVTSRKSNETKQGCNYKESFRQAPADPFPWGTTEIKSSPTRGNAFKMSNLDTCQSLFQH